MNYKLINRLDPLIYLGLVLVGFILPEVVYRIFLFDFTAVLTENEAMIVRSIGAPLYFAAMAFFNSIKKEEQASGSYTTEEQ